jgi:hypothetical protein
VDFADGRRPLPLAVSSEGIDDEGLWLWVARCPDTAWSMLRQGTATVHIDVLPARAALRVAPLAQSITCPRCGMTSHNPNDVREGYCGNCHDWTTKP